MVLLSTSAMAQSINGRWIDEENHTIEVSESDPQYGGYRGYYSTGPHSGKLALQVRPFGTHGYKGVRTLYPARGGTFSRAVGTVFAQGGNRLELRNCISNPCHLETWRRPTVQAVDRKAIVPIDPNSKMRLPGSKHGCTVYLDPNGSGQRWDAFVTIPRAIATKRTYKKLYNAASAWDRRISSLKCEASSRVDCYIAIYSGANRSGDNAMLYGRMGLVNLVQYGWDDRIRSLEVFCSRK
ncbi:hypothetical protein [Chelatococcus sp. YT9]|nr:hypothetical protein [Chelatococcus sp. YT9]MBS7696207.1 hypothetical protein [Chelatococcus sp. YT9]